MNQPAAVRLLGAAELRRLAAQVDLRPTKTLGQNFVHDANTVRRIVAVAGLTPTDHVLEVGPGLGSLTLGLLAAAARVTAVEIDPRLARLLPTTVAEHAPARVAALAVLTADALTVTGADLRAAADLRATNCAAAPAAGGGLASAAAATAASGTGPTALVANLPYNVAVPVLLHLLAELPAVERVLVMVQAEVADRLVAAPGSRVYGVPSVKAAWYGTARRAGSVGRAVFWPVPGVDSALVALRRHQASPTGDRDAVFAVVDAAFAQRRKMLRSALAGWAGSAVAAGQVLQAAGVDPEARGEVLDVAAFGRIAAAGAAAGIIAPPRARGQQDSSRQPDPQSRQDSPRQPVQSRQPDHQRRQPDGAVR